MGFWKRLVNVGSDNRGGLKDLFLNDVQKIEDNQALLKENVLNRNSISLIMTDPAFKQIPGIEKYHETIYDYKPDLGSIVYYQQGNIEHSGIYIGEDMFIHMNSIGKIEKVNFNDFTSKIDMIGTDLWFPCNLEDGHALGLCTAVYIALEIIDNSENYDLSMNNSQQFISGCITNTFNNENHSILGLKHTFAEKFDCNVIWKQWER